MKTNINKRIAYVFSFAILILSVFFLLIGTSFITEVSGHELPVGEEELPPVQEGDPSVLSIDKAASPISGRTSWANASRPLGVVIYLNGVSFAENQVNLQTGMTSESLAKITFTRGETTETPVLICASRDGGYGSKSFFAFFFGGDLVGETVNEYQEGDKVVIDEGCVLKCAEGSYRFNGAIEYIYDGTQWAVPESEPETIEYSGIGVPVDGITNWGKNNGYVGIVIYNEGLHFEENQVHLENNPWTETEKVTFTRDAVMEECVLIAAGLDGSKGICYCSYFFGGDLKNTSLQTGDTVKIKGDFAFTTKEGRYSYGTDLEFIYDGTLWIDKSIIDESLTYITYISEPKEDGNNILFNLKTTTIFSAEDVVTDELKQSIFINGVSVKDLMPDNKAYINYAISRIVLSVDKSALKLDDYDMISIKKGALLKGNESDGLRLRDDETFRYSHTLKRTDYIPNYDYYGKLSSMAIIDNIEIADTAPSVINGVKFDLAHSVWIHFKWAAKTNYDSFQMHLSAEQFVSAGILNEKLCYEYQKLGFFYSVTDLLTVNGKSIYEWMIADAKNGTANHFKVEYLPYEIDSGRVLRIVVADESLLNIGIGVDQSIEFKKGFINLDLGEIQKDSLYSIKAEDATMNNKFSMGVKQENNGVDEQSSGCSGEIRIEDSYWFFLASALLLSIFVLFKKSGRKGDK